MTIDEAIAVVKIERECVIRADVCDRKCEKCDLLQDSTELTDMYEQLAEWLEELKFLKQRKSDIMDSFCKYDVSSFEELVTNTRNKAIDDFVKEYKSCDNRSIQCKKFLNCADCIAEQLKAGGVNEQGI